MNEVEKLAQAIVTLEHELTAELDIPADREPVFSKAQEDDQLSWWRRLSCYRLWTVPVLESYLRDLKGGVRHGRNLMEEKRARMMLISSAYGSGSELMEILPPLADARIARMESTVGHMLDWGRHFLLLYPHVARQFTRPLFSWQDTQEQLSVETVLWGELASFSDRTELLHHDLIQDAYVQGRNMMTEAMQIQCGLQGWASLEQAEQSLADSGPAR